MTKKYILQSKLNGKYLSNLFEDTHNKMFQGTKIDREIYYYDIKQIAEDVAAQIDAIVIEVLK